MSFSPLGGIFACAMSTWSQPVCVGETSQALDPQLARKTYEKLAKGPPGEVRFDAEMTLKEWKAGRLDPDWFMKHKTSESERR